MKRILIINPTLGVGGVERKIADVAQALALHEPIDLQVDLILEAQAPAALDESVFLTPVQASPVNIRCKPASPLIPFFLFIFWYIRSFNPSVIVAYSRRPSMLALTVRQMLWWRQFRVIIGNDSIASHALSLYVKNAFVRRILKKQMQLLYARADLFLAPSRASKLDLVKHFKVPPEKIRVLPNWTRIPPQSDIPKPFDLIYVGRVDAVKQLTRLIRILGQIHKTRPQISLVIVGDGGEMDEVKRAAQEFQVKANVTFVGFQSNVAAYLAQAKIFCLTSRFEGLPIAALEAMAHGLPVITLAYEGADELVHTGETGWICATEDEFCAAVLALLTDEARRTQMGDAARALVEREHGASVLQEYVDLILNGQRGA